MELLAETTGCDDAGSNSFASYPGSLKAADDDLYCRKKSVAVFRTIDNIQVFLSTPARKRNLPIESFKNGKGNRSYRRTL
jgi:hypothetical protein